MYIYTRIVVVYRMWEWEFQPPTTAVAYLLSKKAMACHGTPPAPGDPNGTFQRLINGDRLRRAG